LVLGTNNTLSKTPTNQQKPNLLGSWTMCNLLPNICFT
jgi:hypothetical protein